MPDAPQGAVSPSGFLERLRAGELTLMLGVRSARTADVVRTAASSGHHAVMLDLEHSTMSLDTAAALCASAADLGLVPFVRVGEREYAGVGPLLDGGAQGIVAPRVEDAEQARTLARACRFPPRGQRSQVSSTPWSGMRATPAVRSNPALDAQTIVQVLLETPAAIEQADAIAAVDGVDVVAIGANDLTAELGVPGDFDHPALREAVAAVGAACARHGKLMMVGGVGDLARLGPLVDLGACPLLLTGSDTDLLHSAATARADAFAAWHRERTRPTTQEDR